MKKLLKKNKRQCSGACQEHDYKLRILQSILHKTFNGILIEMCLKVLKWRIRLCVGIKSDVNVEENAIRDEIPFGLMDGTWIDISRRITKGLKVLELFLLRILDQFLRTDYNLKFLVSSRNPGVIKTIKNFFSALSKPFWRPPKPQQSTKTTKQNHFHHKQSQFHSKSDIKQTQWMIQKAI